MENDFKISLEAETFDHKTLAEDIITAEIAIDHAHLAITVAGVEIVFNLKDWVRTITSGLVKIDVADYIDMQDPDLRGQLRALIQKRPVTSPASSDISPPFPPV